MNKVVSIEDEIYREANMCYKKQDKHSSEDRREEMGRKEVEYDVM